MTAAQVAQVFTGNTLIYGSVETPNSTATYKEFTLSKTESITVDRQFKESDADFVACAKTGAKVALVRTFGTGYWNTLCLPFSMTADQVKATFGNNAKLRKFDNMSGNTMNFAEATDIVAGDPYLLNLQGQLVSYTRSGLKSGIYVQNGKKFAIK